MPRGRLENRGATDAIGNPLARDPPSEVRLKFMFLLFYLCAHIIIKIINGIACPNFTNMDWNLLR